MEVQEASLVVFFWLDDNQYSVVNMSCIHGEIKLNEVTMVDWKETRKGRKPDKVTPYKARIERVGMEVCIISFKCTVPCRGNIPRPAGRGSRVAGDPRVESKTDMHILINQPAGARVRTSLVYNVVTICFTGFGYPKQIKTFTN